MAVDKLVDSTQLDADLTSVANAIRTKGGTSSQLAFPAGFVSAVQAIPTGGVTPTGTKNISITQNGVTTEDVTNYANAQITANVPNTYAAADEGKVVSNGALVTQGSDTVTQNDTYDTTLISSLTVNVSGGGGGIDFTDIEQDYSLFNIGGLFKAFGDGTWDSLELSVVSGTNPIEINFGRAIKGFIAYPKSVAFWSLSNAERDGFSITMFADPDETTAQAISWCVHRTRGTGNVNSSHPFNRISSQSMQNGVLSLVPQYPGNASYAPFDFGVPYIFVYWWEETA